MEYILMVILLLAGGYVNSLINFNDAETVIFFTVLLCLFIERKLRLKYRCKQCKKNWALKKIEQRLVGKDSISVLRELKNRNRDGEVIGTSEQYVPGTRYIYAYIYKCKFCGSTETRTHSEDKINA
jgi:hypothetical protein